jgi:hypothetical protein
MSRLSPYVALIVGNDEHINSFISRRIFLFYGLLSHGILWSYGFMDLWTYGSMDL